MKKLILTLLWLCYAFSPTVGQIPKYKFKWLEVSLVPGFGTNGIDCGKYRNGFAFHLLSGYSGGNEFLEYATISNFNKGEVNGIQIAGFVNIIGGNALEFPKKPHRNVKLSEARKKAELYGIQLAGFLNSVTGDVRAWQLAGGFNINANNTSGFQLAGISNLSYKKTFGLQMAGFSNFSGKKMTGLQVAGGVNHGNDEVKGIQLSGIGNLSVETMTGIQITLGANIAKEEMNGLQLGSLNYTRVILGPNSWPNRSKPGMQLGWVNIANRMDGVQIGLINIAKQSHGAHFGLINIFSNAGRVNQRSGPAYGLLNFGDVMHLRASTDDVFATNFSFATGNSQNALVKGGYYLRLTQNSLIYSRNYGEATENNTKPKWALGYGVEKYIYTPKIGIPSAIKFLNYGIQFLHVNWDKKIAKDISLLSRIRVVVGARNPRIPLLSSIYLYGGITLNNYATNGTQNYIPKFGKLFSYQTSKYIGTSWIGYVIGIHFY